MPIHGTGHTPHDAGTRHTVEGVMEVEAMTRLPLPEGPAIDVMLRLDSGPTLKLCR